MSPRDREVLEYLALNGSWPLSHHTIARGLNRPSRSIAATLGRLRHWGDVEKRTAFKANADGSFSQAWMITTAGKEQL